MSFFGIPIRNGIMIGLGAVMSLAKLVNYYLATEGSDNLVAENDDKILLEQNYG